LARIVKVSEFAKAAVERAGKSTPLFPAVWEDSILYHLQFASLEDAKPIPHRHPPAWAFQSNAWKMGGMPSMVLSYVEIDGGIEIMALRLL
jgi:hypothetical protein